MKTDNYQDSIWMLPKPINKDQIIKTSLNVILQKVLIRRGIDLNIELEEYLSPPELPNPEDHFNQLCKC